MIRILFTKLKNGKNLSKFHLSNIKSNETSCISQLSFSTDTANTAASSSLAEEVTKWEATLDRQARQRLFEIKVEMKVKYENGENVGNPDEVTVDQWESILALSSKSSRVKEYNYFGRKIIWKTRDKEKKEKKKILGSELKEAVLKQRNQNEHIIYGLGHTALYNRINSLTMDRRRNVRLLHAKQFGEPKIIFDCSYDSYMAPKFTRYTARHLTQAYSDNRKNLQPFDMHICKPLDESPTILALERFIPSLNQPGFTMDLHDECVTDLYSAENLVYITPYSKNLLSEYNGSDNFVIPAVIDKGYNGPISLSRAKRLNIRTAWFPINRYLTCSPHSKFLPLDIIIKILLDFKNKQNWNEAFKHIPRRKLASNRYQRPVLSSITNSVVLNEYNKVTGIATSYQEIIPQIKSISRDTEEICNTTKNDGLVATDKSSALNEDATTTSNSSNVPKVNPSKTSDDNSHIRIDVTKQNVSNKYNTVTVRTPSYHETIKNSNKLPINVRDLFETPDSIKEEKTQKLTKNTRDIFKTSSEIEKN